MKKFNFGFIIVVISVLLLSCNNSNSVTAEEGGIQIDPELKELGELNALLLQYDDAGDKLDDCIAVKSKRGWGLINLKGDTIIDFKYDKIERLADADFWNIKVKNVENSKYSDRYDVGIADAKGRIIIEPLKGKEYCLPLSEGLFKVVGSNEPQLYNDKGEEIILGCDDGYDFPLCDIKKVNDIFYMVSNCDNLWYRMIYNKGAEMEFIIDSIAFLDVKPSSDYCFVKNENERWGAINEKGDIIAPFEYVDTKTLGNDNVFVQNEEGKWGMFNGKNVSAFYDDFYRSIDDYTIGQDGNTYVILDKNGKEVLRNKDMNTYFFYHKGYFCDKDFYYDSKGNRIDSIVLINKYRTVTSDDKFGYADIKGNIIVPPIYSMSADEQDDVPVILLHRTAKDEVINGKRELILETDIFNTNSLKLITTPFSISNFHGKYALASIGKRHIYVNEEGKTGILNFEEVLEMQEEKVQQSKQEEQTDMEEKIKQQLVETINKENDRKVLSGTYSIHELKKLEDGTYRAEFYDKQVYETFTYEIFGIKVDDDYNVLDFDLKVIMIKPHANKPDGTMNVDEMVDRMTGRIRR